MVLKIAFSAARGQNVTSFQAAFVHNSGGCVVTLDVHHLLHPVRGSEYNPSPPSTTSPKPSPPPENQTHPTVKTVMRSKLVLIPPRQDLRNSLRERSATMQVLFVP